MRRAGGDRFSSFQIRSLYIAFIILVLFPMGLFLSAPSARAQAQKIQSTSSAAPLKTNITSDTMTHSGDKYYFQGSVLITRGDLTAGGDRAVYDEKTSDLHLIGNTYLVDPAIVINAREAFYNMKTKTGKLYDATIFVRQRNFYISGATIDKTAPDVYQFKEAVFTACDSPKPAWSVKGRTAKVVIGDKLVMKDARIKAGPIPVFYTPWFAASISNKRKSGFLSPNAGFSTFGGAYLDIPYYWAIAENRDATVSLDFHSKRAVGGSVEGRYLEPSGISGSEKLAYLRDWKDRVNYLTLSGSHTWPYAFAELDWANHRDYYKLLDFNFQQSERRYLESKGEGHVEVKDYGKAFIRVRLFQDELDGVQESSVIQELPETGFYFYPRKVVQLLGHSAVFDAQTALDNFWRDQGQTALRLNLAPRLSYTIGDGVNFFQSAGVGVRQYDLMSPGRNINRMVFNYDAALRSRLEKTYQDGITHYIEPTLEFFYRNLSGQAPPMVFDSLEMDDQASFVQASVMNRVKDKSGEFLDMLIQDQFDLKAGRAQPITLSISSSRPATVSGSVTYDPYAGKLQAVQVNSSFKPIPQVLLSIIETYTPVQDSWVHNISSQAVLSSHFTVVNAIWYDTTAGLQQFSSELRYSSQCWGIDLVFNKKPGNTAFFARLRLRGIGGGGV